MLVLQLEFDDEGRLKAVGSNTPVSPLQVIDLCLTASHQVVSELSPAQKVSVPEPRLIVPS